MKNWKETLEDYCFKPEEFLPKRLFESITRIRVSNPEAAPEEALRRGRRPGLTLDGRLVIVATDHPGRRVTALRGDPLRMGDRYEYLARALRVLTAPGCDGIMGTPDFLEEVLLLSHLVREARGDSFLDGKVLVGCMNRGGFAGIRGEIDDRFTAYSARELKRLKFEGGKLMYRIVREDERTIKAISDCAQAVTELCREGLYAFVEPLHMRCQADGGYEQLTDAETLIQDVGATAALGESASRTWLKLPYCSGYERVARATTLPILMLGGPAQDTPEPTLRNFASGVQSASNVRGVMVGRNVTYVHREDPGAVGAAVGAIIHEGADAEEAIERLLQQRGKGMDLLQIA
jgi:DhnA family fructose-bisphosphate aldolase class Ia